MATLRRSRSPALHAVCVAVGLLVLAALYLAAMRLTINVSDIHSKADADYRDAVYLALHGGLLFVSLISGFVLGRWLNGLGFAHALLFAVVISLVMIGTQLGSYQLACHAGHNGLVRQWTC